MAAPLVRSWTQLRLLRQSINSLLKYDAFRKHSFQVVTLRQCRLYHATAACFAKKKQKAKQQLQVVIPSPEKKRPSIEIWGLMTVADLSRQTGRDVSLILEALSRTDPNNIYTVNSQIKSVDVTRSTGKLLGYNCRSIVKKEEDVEEEENLDITRRPPPDESLLVKRRPIVTIMGHIDHGKTTLLDSLRHTSVVQSEFGGITQHIGAFNVTLETGEKVTFLDTPGHAAFSAMRARGARATDIVVLVVAADDGVMEQTLESIKMAREAKVPMIVAINKIDKPNADIKRTQQMLQAHDIVVDDLGGTVQSVNISALKGTNLEDLVAAITLEADMMNLKGDPTGLVEGTIIECSNDVARGKLATVLIDRGTLKKGAAVVSGSAWAKVRSMFDHRGKVVQEASLSDAVQIIGWKSLPNVGDELLQVKDERMARRVAEYRQAKLGEKVALEHQIAAEKKHEEYQRLYKEHLQRKRAAGKPRERMMLPQDEQENKCKMSVVVKGDVLGSVEAILDVLDTYRDHELCELDIIHYGVGNVTETDLEMADIFNAVVYAFNVNIPKNLQKEIEQKNVSVRPFNVIYKLVDDLIEEINSKVPTIEVEETIGMAEVQKQFSYRDKTLKKRIYIAGCKCTTGEIRKSDKCRVIRNNQVIHEGNILTLRYVQDEVNVIKSGKDCGIRFEDTSVVCEAGDVIICYTYVQKARRITWQPF